MVGGPGGTVMAYGRVRIGLGALALWGCSADGGGRPPEPPSHEDWGDPQRYPEPGGAWNELTAVAGTCVFSATTGAFTLLLEDIAQTAVLALRPVDSQLLVNGKVCTGTAGATARRIKTVSVAIAGAGDRAAQNLVLDFLTGTFAPGVSGRPGITVTLGLTSVDTVAIRGSSKADSVAVGAGTSDMASVAFNADAFPDITVRDAVVDKLTFSLGDGNDSFTAQGGPLLGGTLAAYTGSLSVFGGGGDDSLFAGSGADIVYGGADADVVNGGLGDDILYGEDGDDVIDALALADGKDLMSCGNGSDRVSYALRTRALKVTVGTPDAPGVDAVLGTADDVVTSDDGDVAANGGAGEQDHVLSGCEQVVGGAANDVLIGDAADNTLTGGAGDDTLQGLGGADRLIGGLGIDLVDYSEKTAPIRVTMAADPDATAGDDGEIGIAEGDDVQPDIESIRGGAGDDQLIGNDAANEFWAGGGNDALTGGKGDDVFHETVSFTAGDDAMLGTADDVEVGNGSDSMDGGEGVDIVDYGARLRPVSVTLDGSAHVPGDDGTATISGSGLGRSWTATERDNVWVTIESVLGGQGDDYVAGDMAAPTGGALAIDNTFDGNAGSDVLRGGYGADLLSGGAGDDVMFGGPGADTIDGGDGADLVDCGENSDIAYGASELVSGTITCELLLQ